MTLLAFSIWRPMPSTKYSWVASAGLFSPSTNFSLSLLSCNLSVCMLFVITASYSTCLCCLLCRYLYCLCATCWDPWVCFEFGFCACSFLIVHVACIPLLFPVARISIGSFELWLHLLRLACWHLLFIHCRILCFSNYVLRIMYVFSHCFSLKLSYVSFGALHLLHVLYFALHHLEIRLYCHCLHHPLRLVRWSVFAPILHGPSKQNFIYHLYQQLLYFAKLLQFWMGQFWRTSTFRTNQSPLPLQQRLLLLDYICTRTVRRKMSVAHCGSSCCGRPCKAVAPSSFDCQRVLSLCGYKVYQSCS